MEIAILGLGCFWGPEIKFSKLDGVIKTEVGYCGGHNAETNYKEVCTGSTNHAEVVKLDFDPKIISYEKIIEFFFKIHDPTQLNKQGPDIGTQYRSEIFCLDDDQYLIADTMKRKLNKEVYDDRIVTSISMADNFWIAEEYHQKYIRKKKNMIF